jgi:V-type H+-transporting ATPase subunit a
VTREKLIFSSLDLGDFERADGLVIHSGWIPRRFTKSLEPRLSQAQHESGSPVPIELRVYPAESKPEFTVPTFIEENEFNSAFQALNDSYGVPCYDELNGGAVYGISPFLFGIMFGDIGHAFFYLLAAFALLSLHKMVVAKNIDLGEMGESVFGFKWLVLFAACCAFYCGLIYNECFGLPITAFRSAWVPNSTAPGHWMREDANYVYPFGIDPEWLFKDNELIFLNSFKMKLSVVVGMCQMILGMILQLIKHVHRRHWLEIAVTWIPEMLYLVPFFGYLVVCIIIKWCTRVEDQPENGVNIIQLMIGMILNIGSKDPALALYGDVQWTVQNVIIVVFILSIPMLLFIKPVIECYHLRGRPDFNVLEIFVMNLIHVIEFCLGALSHTASYLRLWALSLAHSQLSHVLYDELFIMFVNMQNVPALFISFAAFAAFTVAILLGMEAFSALLHAIRLMWVEFSSKFYDGMGVPFQPLSLSQALKGVGIH